MVNIPVCIVCGKKANMMGLFVPDRPMEWGAPEGKQRIFQYSICLKCKNHKYSMQKVEKAIADDLKNLFPNRA